MTGSITSERARRGAVLAILLVAGLVTGCQRANPGEPCNTDDFGDDGAHWVMECRDGQWQWLVTKKQVAEALFAARNTGDVADPGRLLAGDPSPADDYPAAWRSAPRDAVFDTWGFPNRECTSFVMWRLATRNRVALPTDVGDARLWDDRLRPFARVDSVPAVGAIAQWNEFESYAGFTAGSLGHVGWVQAVYADGTVSIEQYNIGSAGTYGQIDHTRAPRYIHLHDL